MKKKLQFTILGIMMLFSMFSLVYAAPQTSTGANNLEIKSPPMQWIKIGETYEFAFHIESRETGLALIATDTFFCDFHLYDQEGSHIWVSRLDETDLEHDYDLEFIPDTNNFSTLGTYYYNLYCECDGCSIIQGYDNLGGHIRDEIVVNEDGVAPEEGEDGGLTTAQAILYGFLLLLLGLFLYFSVYGIRKAVSAEWLIGYVCLTYVVLYLIVSVLWLLSKAYLLGIPMLERVLFMSWFVMGIGFLPFIIVISLVILGQEAKAALEQNYIKQGYSPEEARELSRKNKR